MRSTKKVIFKAARVTQKQCQMLLTSCIGKCYFKLQEKEETEDLKGAIFVMLKLFFLVLNKMQNVSKQVAYPTAEALHMEPVDTLVF